MYQYLLFDLDGTLTDPKEGITKSVQYALDFFGVSEPDQDKLECFIGPPLKEQFMEYCHINEQQAKAAVLKYRERFETVGKFENIPYKGIEYALEQLKSQDRILCVATSKPEIFAIEILRHFGLEHFFDKIVGSDLEGIHTAKAEIIEKAIAWLRVTETQRQKIVMIGDRKYDIIGAKKTGIASIGVTYGYGDRVELTSAGADFIVDSLEELIDLLNFKG